ncbi:MAG: hypothetical protein AB7H88_00105 [Vicinamibacterales bacterium]
MPFLRFTRDRYGYENTVLLHAEQPGARPRVLYWYRSAPAVRVGRAALDEDAIRTIEVQHPDIDFDWPHILEVGPPPPPPPDFDRRSSKPRRKAKRPGGGAAPAAPSEPAASAPLVAAPAAPDAVTEEEAEVVAQLAADDGGDDGAGEEAEEAAVAPVHDVLEQLVGREIATRLRARYAEICARIDEQPFDEATREAWRARAAGLDPDAWVTPQEVVHGVERADAVFDGLRRELLGR